MAGSSSWLTGVDHSSAALSPLVSALTDYLGKKAGTVYLGQKENLLNVSNVIKTNLKILLEKRKPFINQSCYMKYRCTWDQLLLDRKGL